MYTYILYIGEILLLTPSMYICMQIVHQFYKFTFLLFYGHNLVAYFIAYKNKSYSFTYKCTYQIILLQANIILSKIVTVMDIRWRAYIHTCM